MGAMRDPSTAPTSNAAGLGYFGCESLERTFAGG
jgi:hypothetical protein